jgi:hypothetical protein
MSSITRSFKLLLPSTFGDESSSADSDPVLFSIDINNPEPERKRRKSSEFSNEIGNVDNAIRMRCSSMWISKDDTSRKNGDKLSSRKPGTPKPRVKEGGKVSLAKLVDNPQIKSFNCLDKKDILIIGNRRMILVAKCSEDDNAADVSWWLCFTDIESCTITFDSK